MELEKCKRPGCDVRAVCLNTCCGGVECTVKCRKCKLSLEEPLSSACVAEVWIEYLDSEGARQ